jgi:hypothetical protein
MNENGHRLYMATVFCFGKPDVKVDQEWLDKANSRGLLDPEATICDDGIARRKSFHLFDCFSSPHPGPGHQPAVPAELPRLREWSKIPCYRLTTPWKGSDAALYTPFSAKIPDTWRAHSVSVSFIVYEVGLTLLPCSVQCSAPKTWPLLGTRPPSAPTVSAAWLTRRGPPRPWQVRFQDVVDERPSSLGQPL